MFFESKRQKTNVCFNFKILLSVLPKIDFSFMFQKSGTNIMFNLIPVDTFFALPSNLSFMN